MTQEEFLKSLSPEQTDAFIVLRGEIHASCAKQNEELVAEKNKEVDAANKVQDETKAAWAAAEKLKDQALADKDMALDLRDKTVSILSDLKAYILGHSDAISAAVEESAKSLTEKRKAALEAELAALS